MKKLNLLALVAAAVFAGSSAYAHDGKGNCCAGHASNESKEACDTSFANLNLKADQQAKMQKLVAACNKAGCTEANMAKMDKDVKRILSKEQYTTWKSSQASHKGGEKTES